jgi:hypothetical protein
MAEGIEQGDKLHGVMAEYETPEALKAAARAAREAGYREMDAYAPFPVEGLADAIGFSKNRVPMAVLGGGLLGGGLAYFMMWYVNVIDYPLNVGGRPFHSWPAFIPITFELTILFASFGALIGMLVMNGLPKPYHPVFDAPGFERASQDRFFLCIEAEDEQFDRGRIGDFLRNTEAVSVSEVEDRG